MNISNSTSRDCWPGPGSPLASISPRLLSPLLAGSVFVASLHFLHFPVCLSVCHTAYPGPNFHLCLLRIRQRFGLVRGNCLKLTEYCSKAQKQNEMTHDTHWLNIKCFNVPRYTICHFGRAHTWCSKLNVITTTVLTGFLYLTRIPANNNVPYNGKTYTTTE